SLAPWAAPTAPRPWNIGIQGSGQTTRPTVPMSGFGSIAAVGSGAVGSGARWAQPTDPSIRSAATKTASALIDWGPGPSFHSNGPTATSTTPFSALLPYSVAPRTSRDRAPCRRRILEDAHGCRPRRHRTQRHVDRR